MSPLQYAIILLASTSIICASSLVERQISGYQNSEAANNPSTFLRRRWHKSIVIGDYIYIDGGELRFVDGNTTQSIWSNSTYSIDLTQAWTLDTVTLRQIDKGQDAQLVNLPNLWPKEDGKTFYSYNGDIAGSYEVVYTSAPQNVLFEFIPDGQGGGFWRNSGSGGSGFSSLDRVAGAAGTCSAGGVCYAFGGYETERTNSGISLPFSLGSAVSFNQSSGEWRNTSWLADDYLSRPWYNGEVVLARDLGQEGIIILLGGRLQKGSSNALGQFDLLPFTDLLMFDIATQTWHKQSTTVENDDEAQRPGVRGDFCSVGVKGDNGTFEIFIYGGRGSASSQDEVNLQLDAVHVLSLPSFNWHKADFQPLQSRDVLSCNAVGPGQGQLLLIGGGNPDNDSATDPWPLGLRLFNLTSMEWTAQYNPAGSTYETPARVKQWYVDNGDVANISDQTVASWFNKGNTEGNPSPGEEPNAQPTPKSSSGGGSNTGAIIGGSIGGAAVLFIILGAGWFWRRRRRQQSERPAAGLTHNPRQELDGQPRYEKGTVSERHELS